MTCRAPTMDIVSTVPLCGILISGAHASPLVVTANQTTAPLLIAGPSFPPVTQRQISMLPGAPISLTGAPGMPPALYSATESTRAPPALYNAMQSAGPPHSAALQPITGMQPAQTRALSLNAVGDAGVRAAGSSQEVAGSRHSHTRNTHP